MSPTFAIVREYDGASPSRTSTCIGSIASRSCTISGSTRSSTTAGHDHRVGGSDRASAPGRSSGRAARPSSMTTPASRRCRGTTASDRHGRRVLARVDTRVRRSGLTCICSRSTPPRDASASRSGRTRGSWARWRWGARRQRVHRAMPSSSSPRIEYLLRRDSCPARAALGDRRRHRPGDVHRTARRRHDRQGDGAGAAHSRDPGPESGSRRLPAAIDAPARRARASTRGATRCTTPSYRAVPGGLQRIGSTRSGRRARSRRRARGARRGGAARGRRRIALPRRASPSRAMSRSPGPEFAAPSARRARRARGGSLRARGVHDGRRRAADVSASQRRGARRGSQSLMAVASRGRDQHRCRGRPDAPAPPARGAADRAAGVSAPMDAVAVPVGARAACEPCVLRRARRTRRRRLRAA